MQKQAWADRVLPPVESLRPGLWSVPVPLPDSPLRYVSMYVVELRDGAGVVDTGWPIEAAWAALTDGLGPRAHALGDVRAVLVTHVHRDHYGLAGRVREASGAWMGCTADSALLEAATLIEVLPSSNARKMAAPGATAAATRAEAEDVDEHPAGSRRWSDLARPAVRGRAYRGLDVPAGLARVWTPGHSPGHLLLLRRGPRPAAERRPRAAAHQSNIAANPQTARNPLADFLDSLQKVEALDLGEVLPAHEYRFRNLSVRVDQLVEHHQARLDEIEAVLRDKPGATRGRSPSTSPGRGRGTRSPPTCAGPPTGRRWPTSSCSRCRTAW